MGKVKECYYVLINGKYKRVQITRKEKKEERTEDGKIVLDEWCSITNEIMLEYFNTDIWMLISNKEEEKGIKMKLNI